MVMNKVKIAFTTITKSFAITRKMQFNIDGIGLQKLIPGHRSVLVLLLLAAAAAAISLCKPAPWVAFGSTFVNAFFVDGSVGVLVFVNAFVVAGSVVPVVFVNAFVVDESVVSVVSVKVDAFVFFSHPKPITITNTKIADRR